MLGHIYSLYAFVIPAWFRGRLSTENESLMALFEQALTATLLPRHERS
ncbi:hypothetical protein [Desulfobulbus propionicus]